MQRLRFFNFFTYENVVIVSKYIIVDLNIMNYYTKSAYI
jgi:hypothetical protein